ncbi:Uncharacterized protein HZ326_23697 [Fusarium oxysporum f. sp. albedinis]|nr:Uncharacterized protein HZ326_23697 [Fusarium oxysporum f. sp. albedinis]
MAKPHSTQIIAGSGELIKRELDCCFLPPNRRTTFSPVALFVGPLMNRDIYLHLDRIASQHLGKTCGM